MSFLSTLLLACGLLQTASAAPASETRSLSCPASKNSVIVAGSHRYTIECGTDRNGGDMPAPNGRNADTIEACISQCEARSGCVLVDWALWSKACYLKSTVGFTVANSQVIGARLVVTIPTMTSSSSAPVRTKATSATTSPTVASSSSASGSIRSSSAITTPTITSSSTAPTSSKVTSTTSAAPVASGARKRGLCYNNPALTNFFGGSGSKVSWMYNWSTNPGNGANTATRFIPMLWSNSVNGVAAWSAAAKTAIAAGADALLGFNEPDLNTQANMAVSTSVSAWKQSMEPFAGQVKLVSPAVTNGGSPMGLAYLSSFIQQCAGCHIDACAIHWYDSATNIAYFKAYIPQAYAACGNKPIWLTEFGASGTDAQIVTFLQTVLPWLDSLDYVERYAYFYAGASTDGQFLVNSAGNGMSTIGQVYNSY